MSDPISATVLNTQFASLPGISETGAGSAVAGQGAVSGGVQGDGFTATLGNMISGVNHDLKQAEAMSIKGIKGEASAYEVASAVMEAEQTIRMAVSVRDKIVNAYLEISRMQI